MIFLKFLALNWFRITEEKPGWCSDPHLPPCAAYVEEAFLSAFYELRGTKQSRYFVSLTNADLSRSWLLYFQEMPGDACGIWSRFLISSSVCSFLIHFKSGFMPVLLICLTLTVINRMIWFTVGDLTLHSEDVLRYESNTWSLFLKTLVYLILVTSLLYDDESVYILHQNAACTREDRGSRFSVDRSSNCPFPWQPSKLSLCVPLFHLLDPTLTFLLKLPFSFDCCRVRQ